MHERQREAIRRQRDSIEQIGEKEITKQLKFLNIALRRKDEAIKKSPERKTELVGGFNSEMSLRIYSRFPRIWLLLLPNSHHAWSSSLFRSGKTWKGLDRAVDTFSTTFDLSNRRVKPGLGFISPERAWNTFQEDEVMHMVGKGQMRGLEKGDSLGQGAFISRLFGVAA